MRTTHLPALLALAIAASAASCIQPSLPDSRSSEKFISSFTVASADNPGLGLAGDLTMHWVSSRKAYAAATILPWDADLSAVVTRFTLSAGASASVDGVALASGVTPVDFRAGALYRITAENGSTADYLATLDKGTPPPAAGSLGVSVTFACYNAEDFYRGSTARHAQIATMLRNASVELVILVETEVTGASSDVALLKAELAAIGWPLPYSWGVETGYEDDIVIVSKYPIQSQQAILTANPRQGLQAVVRVSNALDEYADITVMGFHLKAMDDPTSLSRRIAQSSELAGYLRTAFASTIETGYFILAGDMNTVSTGDRGSATSTMGYLRLYDDADAGNDFWAVNESLLPGTATHQMGSVLDHVILSPGLTARYRAGSVTVKTSDLDVVMTDLSDHFPVLLELDL